MNDSINQECGSQFLPEITNGETTPHTCCPKKRLLIIVLVVSGVVALIVIPTVIVTTSDEPSPPEHIIENYSCLYYDFSKNCNDTLGHRCLNGSEFVKGHCKQNGVHNCDHCKGHLLPKFCFCDKVDDCDGDDLSRKKKCVECRKNDSCPCLNGGTCVCDKNSTGKDIRCNCPEGYDGDYCGIIRNRVCVRNKTVSNLNHCKGSQEPECFIRDSAQNSSLICAIQIDKHQSAKLEKCSEQ